VHYMIVNYRPYLFAPINKAKVLALLCLIMQNN
jgi:hypothetical protein